MQHNNSIYKLTALWAFAECSLGGLMHLFKIPFTGFLVGGFAVIIIGLIAFFSNQNFKVIIQSTILVILVKAAVSPHSPPPAYFAVLFQGFFGAIIFSGLGFNKISTIIFGTLAMVESSLQMIVSKTIFYGMSFWKAIDLLFISILKDFGLNSSLIFSFWLIISYVLLYAFWGMILGIWCAKLPYTLSIKWHIIASKISNINVEELPKNEQNFNTFKWLSVLFTLIFITTVLCLNGEKKWDAILIIVRTIAVISFLYFFVSPVLKLLLKKYSATRQNQINNIVYDLPKIKLNAQLAYDLASKNKKGVAKYIEFVWILITLTLYYEA